MPLRWESGDRWTVSGTLPSLEELAIRVPFRALLDEERPFSGVTLPDGVVLDVSERSLAFVGARREDVVGLALWDTGLCVDPDSSATQEALVRAAGGERARVAIAHHRTGGEPVPVVLNARPVRSAEGEVRFLLVECVELPVERGPPNLSTSGDERTVDELRASAARLGRARELANIGVIEAVAPFGPEDTVWSEEVYRIFGRDLARGPAPFDEVRHALVHSGDREAVVQELRGAVTERRPAVIECRTIREDGSVRRVQARFGVELDERGEPARWIGAVRDVTEQREGEHELLHGKKLEALARFTAGIAHEYNNLLMGVQGCTKLALRRMGDDHPGARFVLEAERAAKRGAALTRQLLEFSARRESTDDSVDVDRLLARSEAMLRAVVGDRIELSMDLAAPRWRPQGDPVQLEQALLNLVLNARDAMPDGGALAITTREVELGPTEMGPEPGEYVVVSVLDSGAGMDVEAREHAFEPFYTTKRAGEGSGLGLSMVYGALRSAGGDVLLESEPGRGTTVTLFLPRARERVRSEPAEGREPSDRPVPRQGRERVLVVEDEPLIRMTLRGYLEPHGYDVVEACDVAESYLDLLRNGPFDLVITDVMLPDGTGPQVAARAHAVSPATPVIFMSAHSARLLQESGQIPNDAVLLQKPFGEAALMTEIERLLGPGARLEPGSDDRADD